MVGPPTSLSLRTCPEGGSYDGHSYRHAEKKLRRDQPHQGPYGGHQHDQLTSSTTTEETQAQDA